MKFTNCLEHWLHVLPVTPVLQRHCPVTSFKQTVPWRVPFSSQLQAIRDKNNTTLSTNAQTTPLLILNASRLFQAIIYTSFARHLHSYQARIQAGLTGLNKPVRFPKNDLTPNQFLWQPAPTQIRLRKTHERFEFSNAAKSLCCTTQKVSLKSVSHNRAWSKHCQEKGRSQKIKVPGQEKSSSP